MKKRVIFDLLVSDQTVYTVGANGVSRTPIGPYETFRPTLMGRSTRVRDVITRQFLLRFVMTSNTLTDAEGNV